MPRGKKCRRICAMPQVYEFAPLNREDAETVQLGIDELETIRLLDYERLTQEECAVQMNVARTTVTSIYEEARNKIAQALIGGKRLVIAGGNYELCEKAAHCCGRCGTECNGCKKECRKKEQEK